jgi:Domain of unknown function (DUF4440)
MSLPRTVVALASLVLAASLSLAVVHAADVDLEAATVKALDTVFGAIASGDASQIEPLLAPEFQVQRSDGVGYDKSAYVGLALPKIAIAPTYTDISVTRNDDIVVARFMLDVVETIRGRETERVSPQLMVFRVTPDGWQVVAAANFSAIK